MASRSRVLRWRKIPGPPPDPTKARLLRLYVALGRRFGAHVAGTPRVEARRLQAFTRWRLERFGGRLDSLRRAPLPALRREMLAIPGLGPETVDVILLYTGGRPVFVADARARMILARHGFVPEGTGYEETRHFVEAHLPSDPALFREFHARLVAEADLTASPAAGPRSAPRRRGTRPPAPARPSP
jgi:hypothetical protein